MQYKIHYKPNVCILKVPLLNLEINRLSLCEYERQIKKSCYLMTFNRVLQLGLPS